MIAALSSLVAAVAVATFVLTFEVLRTVPFFNARMLPVWLLRRQSARPAR